MSLLTIPVGTRAIFRVNPVAKLAAALVLAGVLMLTIDWVSALVALGCEFVLFFWAGLSARMFLLRTLPVWLAAPMAGLTTLLYGQAAGQVYWTFGLIHVTEGSSELAVATTLRILAIGLPSVVLFVTVDPTDLADGLAQVVRLPSRFVLGGLAGLRLVGLFIEDWRALELARRARGIGDGGAIRRLGSQAFALLVLSIRRGSKLATAMEARGFGAPITRTWARESSFGGREYALVGIGLFVALLAVSVSVATGSWNFVLG
ncbi:energy-coupling factor transporter transmembrane component T [Cryobacterium sp. PH31-AA6]|uniref:energy-coupling factor transporter transmembrane component T family protein n=1 Tax=Cryobacterium sp. PH31-AA6 TaxID=3046205 RepID=UPI0024BAE716|nr:energy-coupling factor transporter transmembrane component T [Cryobacterium sp. PH31-AA6]MDJ0324511.1 energy-coupling factor transporter transmembrane component T [Cryobacterium sp. PH31-AA6]